MNEQPYWGGDEGWFILYLLGVLGFFGLMIWLGLRIKNRNKYR